MMFIALTGYKVVYKDLVHRCIAYSLMVLGPDDEPLDIQVHILDENNFIKVLQGTVKDFQFIRSE